MRIEQGDHLFRDEQEVALFVSGARAARRTDKACVGPARV